MINLKYIYFFMRALTSSPQEVLAMLAPPSFSPLIGSRTSRRIRIIAKIPKAGVIRNPHCHEPVALAVSPPAMYPRPLKKCDFFISLHLEQFIILLL